MSVENVRLTQKIAEVLGEYTARSEESALLHAYEVGRESMQRSSGILSFVSAYGEVLANELSQTGATDETLQLAQAWGEVLVEGLGPFEMAHQGYREANASLGKLNEALHSENAERRRAEADLVKAKESAERANREKSAFLSRMSHELRTPLNAVMGFAQLLELEDLDPEHHDSARRIGAAGRHLLGLINELLDIGRIDAGELALSVEPVRVGDLLTEAVDMIQPLAAERSLEVSLDRGASDLYVMANRQRLKQAVLNLLGNAVKYNLEGGTVTIGCAQRVAGRLRIEVTDTGPGIAPEDLERLFAPFDRLGAGGEGAVEGSGLGLALSKRLVELMGGTMGVASEVGVGSMFWLELPSADPLEEIAEVLPAPGELVPTLPGGSAKPAAVLYIEDNPSNLALVERILVGRPEIKLTSSMQGRLGFELARQHLPDLILLDLNLPDVSGEEVLKRLQADPATRAIPVIVVTADASAGLSQRLLAAGARACIKKPFDVPHFIRTIDEILAG